MGDCGSRPRMANSSTVVALRPPFHRCIETIHRQGNGDTTGPNGPPPAAVGAPPRTGAVAYIDAVRRSVVDYSLQRRAVLADVYSGRTGLFGVCDASPHLSRAAKYHGEAIAESCPVCRRERLTLVNYVYGENLGHVAGQ